MKFFDRLFKPPGREKKKANDSLLLSISREKTFNFKHKNSVYIALSVNEAIGNNKEPRKN